MLLNSMKRTFSPPCAARPSRHPPPPVRQANFNGAVQEPPNRSTWTLWWHCAISTNDWLEEGGALLPVLVIRRPPRKDADLKTAVG